MILIRANDIWAATEVYLHQESMETQSATAGVGFTGKHEFEIVFREYYSALCRYASMWIPDADDAEEVVQHVFVKLWEKRESQHIGTSLKAYLYKAVYHTALNEIRRKKVRTGFEEMNSHITEHNRPEDRASVKELEARISDAIRNLPEQCALIFRMSRFGELRYREIADILGISVKTVENQMGKALKLMRHNLSDFMTLLLCIHQLFNQW